MSAVAHAPSPVEGGRSPGGGVETALTSARKGSVEIGEHYMGLGNPNFFQVIYIFSFQLSFFLFLRL